jgi:hypothetical protein
VNEVADYVAQVRTALADLAPAVREELLEDLPEHLAEVAAEGEGSLTERLGPPAAYAAELRAAAGAPAGEGRRAAVDARLRDAVDRARARLQVVDAKSGPLIGYQKGSDFVRLLRPAWWVMRGYLVAMALVYMLSAEPIGLLPRVELGDSTIAGVVVLLAFVIGSIWLGDRGRRLPRVPRYALGVGIALLVLAAMAALSDIDGYAQDNPYAEVSNSSYDDVESVYVYDEQGRPLTTARVFDQNGNQVQPGLWWCRTESGGTSTEIYPTCPNPQPLNGQPDFIAPAERIPLEGPTSEATVPQPSTTPSPTPSAGSTPPPEPTGTPTPAPSATR